LLSRTLRSKYLLSKRYGQQRKGADGHPKGRQVLIQQPQSTDTLPCNYRQIQSKQNNRRHENSDIKKKTDSHCIELKVAGDILPGTTPIPSQTGKTTEASDMHLRQKNSTNNSCQK